ncbi:MAG: 16S rRNA (adenine(1518)-N(6)/adenine(1519)-N(6))-dimethyltransferase RsmA [Gammaproteobacteria bacterium]|nr:16S rRNA (adenine(1518)-N(6)/adenine(1519)-N(6))-dimethyltransferase RsmA [Gammaproteobacteria bacterium]MDH3767040.1 16S rRNA (adenine(1518)-N(6)/adenine(1519)-N(6))-dimethyltransferase RsmA [Gammaproteobacteria bacterium]
MPVRKRFGQHFLHDPQVIERIVDTLDPKPGENLVEIGPGRGALTTRVLQRAGSLDVIEVDRDLAQLARDQLGQHGALRVHEADALKFDFASLKKTHLRVFGNLPYNISTPLLFHLMKQSAHISDMLFMLQREVVERMTASTGNKTYGRLTIMLAAVARVEYQFGVGRGAFHPPPRVDSAVVRLVPHATPPFELADPELFTRVVRVAFSHRRKTLRNALASLATVADIEAAGQDPAARPETIDPAGFSAITREIEGR